jgi:hypothetical protein
MAAAAITINTAIAIFDSVWFERPPGILTSIFPIGDLQTSPCGQAFAAPFIAWGNMSPDLDHLDYGHLTPMPNLNADDRVICKLKVKCLQLS